MEHWFDRLAHPHTRRTTLRTAALAIGALALPNRLLPAASATAQEPCYKPCVDAAKQGFSGTKNGVCKALAGPTLFAGLTGLGTPVGVIVELAGAWQWTSCLGSAELSWRRAIDACRGSECGNPSKYPGGSEPAPPPPTCDPTQQIRCGDHCCNIVDKCCQCQADGAYICCSAGSPCEPTPDRGGCCVGH
jgi:hypothetical protein